MKGRAVFCALSKPEGPLLEAFTAAHPPSEVQTSTPPMGMMTRRSTRVATERGGNRGASIKAGSMTRQASATTLTLSIGSWSTSLQKPRA